MAIFISSIKRRCDRFAGTSLKKHEWLKYSAVFNAPVKFYRHINSALITTRNGVFKMP